MSADLLRRAAAKLREAASEEYLPPGPWGTEWEEPYGWRVIAPEEEICGNTFQAHADYIALMHPPVALALSDLLAKAALIVAGYSDDIDVEAVAYEHLAVARAILREEP